MRKTKIILPVLTGLAITSSVVPLVSCSKENIEDVRTWALETVSTYANEFSRFFNTTTNALPEVLNALKTKADKYINECKDSLKIKSMVYFARHAFAGVTYQPETISDLKLAFDEFNKISEKFNGYKFQAQADSLSAFVGAFPIQPEIKTKASALHTKACYLINNASSEEQAFAYARMASAGMIPLSIQPEIEKWINTELANVANLINSIPGNQIDSLISVVENWFNGIARQPEAQDIMSNLIFGKEPFSERNCLTSLLKAFEIFNGNPNIINMLSRYYSSLVLAVAANPEMASTSWEFFSTHNVAITLLGEKRLPYALKTFSASLWKYLQCRFELVSDPGFLDICNGVTNYLFQCTSDDQIEKVGQLFIDYTYSAPFEGMAFREHKKELIEKVEAVLKEEEEDKIINKVVKKEGRVKDSHRMSISCNDQTFGKSLCLDNVIAWDNETAETNLFVMSDYYDGYNIRVTGIKMGNKSLMPGYDFVWDQYIGSIRIFEPVIDDITISVQYYET